MLQYRTSSNLFLLSLALLYASQNGTLCSQAAAAERSRVAATFRWPRMSNLKHTLLRRRSSQMIVNCHRERKFLSTCLPESVSTDSGWHCTPINGYCLGCIPMMMSSSVSAVTCKSAGNDFLSQISE